MRIDSARFAVTDWDLVDAIEHPGERGKAVWRTVQSGNVRIRKVQYSPGYVADHWCEKGHALLVLDGELRTELRDGPEFVLRAGDSYVVADGVDAHRSRSPTGATLFIVD